MKGVNLGVPFTPSESKNVDFLLCLSFFSSIIFTFVWYERTLWEHVASAIGQTINCDYNATNASRNRLRNLNS